MAKMTSGVTHVAVNCLHVSHFLLQMSVEVQEELLLLLRSQQRELDELRQSQQELLQRLTGHMDAVQSSIMAHVEHVLLTQQEQGRILFPEGACPCSLLLNSLVIDNQCLCVFEPAR